MLPEMYPLKGTEGYPRTAPMRVIVCGFPRTGTFSTHIALQMLGFNRTHHMLYAVTDSSGREFREWTRALRAKYRGEGTFTKLDWDRLLGDCQGVIDYPSVLFAADLARLYPEAKVVMLNRDPDAWYESVSETIAVIQRPGPLTMLKRAYCWLVDARRREEARFWREISHAEGDYDHDAERDKAIAYMQRSYEECRAAVAAERRIEWTVRDGWEPLCRHLGVEVPMVEDAKTGEMVVAPFPKVNDRAMFLENKRVCLSMMIAAANEIVFAWLGRGLVGGAVGYGVYRAWKMYSWR